MALLAESLSFLDAHRLFEMFCPKVRYFMVFVMSLLYFCVQCTTWRQNLLHKDALAIDLGEFTGLKSARSLVLEKKSKQSSNIRYSGYDTGGHWCEICNQQFPTIPKIMEHLHREMHTKESKRQLQANLQKPRPI